MNGNQVGRCSQRFNSWTGAFLVLINDSNLSTDIKPFADDLFFSIVNEKGKACKKLSNHLWIIRTGGISLRNYF